MQYNADDIFNQALEVISNEPINTISDLVCFLPIGSSWFYERFPADSEKMEAIKKAIDKRKVERKSKMRNAWEKSDNPTLQVAAYKLAADDNELERLSVAINKNQNSGSLTINWNEQLTDEAERKTE